MNFKSQKSDEEEFDEDLLDSKNTSTKNEINPSKSPQELPINHVEEAEKT